MGRKPQSERNTHPPSRMAADRHSEQRLKHAQQIANVGSWEWDIRTGAVSWSEQVYRQLGEDPLRFTPTHDAFLQRIHREDRAAYEQAMRRALAATGSYDLELRMLRSDGRTCVLHTRGEVVRGPDGQPRSMSGVCLDITERKRAEQELFAVHERLSALMKATPVGVSFSDDPSCERITGNPTVLAQFEVGAGDNLSASAPNPDAPGRQVRFFRDGRQITDRDLPLQRAVAENREIAPMELEVALPSGRRWIAQGSGAPVRDAHGQVIGGVAVTVDITERKRAEEALRASEERFRVLAESMPQIVWSADATGAVDYCNALALDYGGARMENLSGSNWLSFVHPDDLALTKSAWRQTLATGLGDQIEHRLRRADGEYRWHLSRGVPVRNEKAEITRWIGSATDIHDRKTAEQELERRVVERTAELARTTALLETVTANAPLVLTATDAQGVFTVHTGKAIATSGGEPGELVGKHYQELLPELPQNVEFIRRALGGESVTETLSGRQGSTFESRFTPLRDAEGTIAGMIAVSMDITERRRAEDAVRNERQRLFDVLEALPAMICLLTADYRVAFANRSFREKFGESRGEHCYERCFGRTAPCQFCESYGVLKTGQPHRWEFITPDKTVIEAYDFPFTDVDGSAMILEMEIDITERKRADEEIRQLSARLIRVQEDERRRLALELHDTTAQSLAGILAYLKVIQQSSRLTKRVKECLHSAILAAKQSSRELRNMSYLLRPPILDLLGLVPALRWYVEQYQQQMRITVELDVSPQVCRLAPEVEIALFRIAQESLTNIARHSGSSLAKVALRTAAGGLVLRVADEGRGMTFAKTKRPQRVSRGLGIGVPGMREPARQIGAQFDITSSDKGTTVCVTLPATAQRPPV